MPVYEYECDVCGIRFKDRRHFGDPEPEVCPAGHEEIHRIFVAPTIIFKGSGFYVTDHPSNGRTRRESSKAGETPAAKSGTKEGEKA